MSTVIASYTPVCRSPMLPAPSGTRSASHSWRPAAAFPASVAIKCRRPLSVTCALSEKQRPAFSIPPTALLYPVPPTDGKERWDIKDEGDYVKLWFQVPGLKEDDLEITVSEDMLEIKRKGAKIGDGDEETPAAVHGVGFFLVRLLMTREYDRDNVKAELKAGMLEVTVGKSKQRTVNSVWLGTKSPDKDDKSTGPGAAATTAGSDTTKGPDKDAKGLDPGPGAGATMEGSGTTKGPDKNAKSSDPSPGAGATIGGSSTTKGPDKNAKSPDPSPGAGTTKGLDKDAKSQDPGLGTGATIGGSGTTKGPDKNAKSPGTSLGAGATTGGSGTTEGPNKDAKSPDRGPGAGATTGGSGTTEGPDKDAKSPFPGPGAGTTTGGSGTTKGPDKDAKSPDPGAGATTGGSGTTKGPDKAANSPNPVRGLGAAAGGAVQETSTKGAQDPAQTKPKLEDGSR